MKSILKKISIFSLCLGAALAVPNLARAQDAEGVSSRINPADLETVKSWIENTKQDLARALELAKRVGANEQELVLRRAINSVLSRVTKPSEEFLSRNVLYRATEVHDLLLTVQRGPKRDAFARQFLMYSVTTAIDLAPQDVASLETTSGATIGAEKRLALGFEWATGMLSVSFSLPTNKSHYEFLTKIMGFLYNDILRDDAYNRKLAGVASHFAEKAALDSHIPLNNPMDYLTAVKNLRDFLSQEIKIAAETVKIKLDKPVAKAGDVKEAPELKGKLSDVYGRCALIYPGYNDKKGYNCGNKFGVAYNGFFANKQCHDSVAGAVAAMQAMNGCNHPDSSGDFSILFGGYTSRDGRVCSDKQDFGVTYKGFFYDEKRACFDSISEAIEFMRTEAKK